MPNAKYYHQVQIRNAVGDLDGLTTTTGFVNLTAGSGFPQTPLVPSELQSGLRIRIVDLWIGFSGIVATATIFLGTSPGAGFVGPDWTPIWTNAAAVSGSVHPFYLPDDAGRVLKTIDFGNGFTRFLSVQTTGAGGAGTELNLTFEYQRFGPADQLTP